MIRLHMAGPNRGPYRLKRLAQSKGFPKSKRGNDAIFVVIDKLTKVAHFLPIKESITAAQLAELYLSNCLSARYSTSDLFRSWQHLYLQVLGIFPEGHGHQHPLQHSFPSAN